MVVTGACALGLGLGRVHPALGAVAVLAALGVPLLTTPGEGKRRVARPDVRQAAFCYVAGVVAPVLCLIFDPIIFTDFGMLGAHPWYRAGCYTFMAIEMATMVAWLWARESFGRMSALVAGALWAGAMYAWGLGLLMFPLSVIGLMAMGIGVFGFTPFFTGAAFFIQAKLATSDADAVPSPGRGALAARLAVGTSLAIGPALLAQWLVSF
jgi:hypothetical protein